MTTFNYFNLSLNAIIKISPELIGLILSFLVKPKALFLWIIYDMYIVISFFTMVRNEFPNSNGETYKSTNMTKIFLTCFSVLTLNSLCRSIISALAISYYIIANIISFGPIRILLSMPILFLATLFGCYDDYWKFFDEYCHDYTVNSNMNKLQETSMYQFSDEQMEKKNECNSYNIATMMNKVNKYPLFLVSILYLYFMIECEQKSCYIFEKSVVTADNERSVVKEEKCIICSGWYYYFISVQILIPILEILTESIMSCCFNVDNVENEKKIELNTF